MGKKTKDKIKKAVKKAVLDAARETAERIIMKGKMTPEEIAECIPELSLDEIREIETEYKELLRRWYRVNVFCPNCKEEHIYFDILITEEEQKQMDDYYKEHQGLSSLALAILGPPLFVERTNLKCPCCKAVFNANIGVTRTASFGYDGHDCIQLGRSSIPLFESP